MNIIMVNSLFFGWTLLIKKLSLEKSQAIGESVLSPASGSNDPTLEHLYQQYQNRVELVL